MNILVTGGCGFIGSHLVDRLVHDGHNVKAYDILESQVHCGRKPSYLNKDVDYVFADVRDKNKLKKHIINTDVIFHFASQVGIGQSMYEIEKYVSNNALGTSVLLDVMVNSKNRVRKLVCASSMSIYGEGAYLCSNCGKVNPAIRNQDRLDAKEWDPLCPICGISVKDIPTSEDKPLMPLSVYATTKRDQEELCIQIGRCYDIPAVALRFFNVYGPRQSLSNPYTGVVAIFSSRIKNEKPPLIFEDGRQTRDFVYVSDIVDANILAMEKKEADYQIYNVGTGKPHSIGDVASKLIGIYGNKINSEIPGRARAGDIRHCYADITKISTQLGFLPKVSFDDGMRKMFEWSRGQVARDYADKAQGELERRGLS